MFILPEFMIFPVILSLTTASTLTVVPTYPCADGVTSNSTSPGPIFKLLSESDESESSYLTLLSL